MKPGINHIEIWVSDIEISIQFYKGILELIGWSQSGSIGFVSANLEIYFKEQKNLTRSNSTGVRHICFQATHETQINEVYQYLKRKHAKIIRGPIELNYSHNYLTIDFYDPDGLILEVAYTPNMGFK